MAATYTFDVFSSLDGYGAHSGDWGGYWGKQGPELLDHRLALYGQGLRMVFGANAYGCGSPGGTLWEALIRAGGCGDDVSEVCERRFSGLMGRIRGRARAMSGFSGLSGVALSAGWPSRRRS